MKIERLRNKKSTLIFLCGFLMVVVLLITLVFKGSKAKYRNSQIIPLINTEVKNNVSDFTVMGIYLNDDTGTEVGKDGKKYIKQANNFIIPESGFVINEINSYCEKFDKDKNVIDTNAKLYTNILGKHSMEGISKGDKCYIYLDTVNTKYISVNAKTVLFNVWGYENEDTITERTDFNTIRTDTGNKLHKALDDDGWSYYLVGQPENNWVKFGGFYWRIVRINGDGTLRMIYSESEQTGPQIKGTGTRIGDSAWYSSTNVLSAEYVGYFWKLGEQHGLETPSTMYEKLNDFYKNNLTNYSGYIDKNAGFCNDRSISTGTGIGSEATVFSARDRLNVGAKPILTCPDNNDLFTANGATKGNGVLEYPIGLVTTDEVALGGLKFGTGNGTTENMYHVNLYYWTFTPYVYDLVNGADVFGVYAEGLIRGYYVNNATKSIRPVINLVKDINFSKGNGSIISPFEI